MTTRTLALIIPALLACQAEARSSTSSRLSGSHTRGGRLAGIIIGAIAVFLVITLFACVLFRKWRTRRMSRSVGMSHMTQGAGTMGGGLGNAETGMMPPQQGYPTNQTGTMNDQSYKAPVGPPPPAYNQTAEAPGKSRVPFVGGFRNQ